MKTIKISAAYWAKLDDRGRKFIETNAGEFGVPTCKRIITIASQFFPEWDDICNYGAALRSKGDRAYLLYLNSWVVFRGANVLGTIYKGDGIGINERVKMRTADGRYVEIYNNIQWKLTFNKIKSC